MAPAADLWREFTQLLQSYLDGRMTLSGYLTWEVEFTFSEEAKVDENLTAYANGLSLVGHEVLYGDREEAEFAQEAQLLLAQFTAPIANLDAAGG